MRFRLIIISSLFLINLIGLSQKPNEKQFKVVFYNVENLFDTIDNPLTSDIDFLPDSKVAWNTVRYFQKIQHTGRVLVSIDSLNLPGIIGLAEIENRSVLEDLIALTGLKQGKYQIIMEEGQDPRGIDVALMYRTDLFKEVNHQAIPSAYTFKTRDILYARLESSNHETYHLFVNHWKSREGGSQGTEVKRIENAGILKHLTDSILIRYPKANVIIVGDFNDEPGNRSIAEILGAEKPGLTFSPASLYNLLYDPYEKGEGTLYYKDWDVFDQIIVSGNMLMKKKGKAPLIVSPYAYIFKPDWILYKNKSGESVPNRTASSKEYYGGYSDHLPVYTSVKN